MRNYNKAWNHLSMIVRCKLDPWSNKSVSIDDIEEEELFKISQHLFDDIRVSIKLANDKRLIEEIFTLLGQYENEELVDFAKFVQFRILEIYRPTIVEMLEKITQIERDYYHIGLDEELSAINEYARDKEEREAC